MLSCPGKLTHGITPLFKRKEFLSSVQCSLEFNPQQHMENAVAPHSSTLAWKIPWTEEPGRLQSMGLRRVGHNWVTSLSLFTFMHWRRKWQPTPIFLPGESQGWEPGGLLSMGSHRVGHDWSDLAAAGAAEHTAALKLRVIIEGKSGVTVNYSVCQRKNQWLRMCVLDLQKSRSIWPKESRKWKTF